MKADYYQPNTQVFVTAPGDANRHRIGTVDTTRNLGGDMLHVVRFTDGTKASYWADELTSLKAGY